MKLEDLCHRKSGWDRMPDVISNLPRVLNSSLTAAQAARVALDSTMDAVDAAKAGPRASRLEKPERAGGRVPIRRGLILVGSAVALGLGSAAVSSMRQREASDDTASFSMREREASDDTASFSMREREASDDTASFSMREREAPTTASPMPDRASSLRYHIVDAEPRQAGPDTRGA